MLGGLMLGRLEASAAWKSTKVFYFKRKIRNFSEMGLLMGCGTSQMKQPISKLIPTGQDEATSHYWNLKIPVAKRVLSKCLYLWPKCAKIHL
jgi:hypothetical protein